MILFSNRHFQSIDRQAFKITLDKSQQTSDSDLIDKPAVPVNIRYYFSRLNTKLVFISNVFS